jgi:hypothetical protein
LLAAALPPSPKTKHPPISNPPAPPAFAPKPSGFRGQSGEGCWTRTREGKTLRGLPLSSKRKTARTYSKTLDYLALARETWLSSDLLRDRPRRPPIACARCNTKAFFHPFALWSGPGELGGLSQWGWEGDRGGSCGRCAGSFTPTVLLRPIHTACLSFISIDILKECRGITRLGHPGPQRWVEGWEWRVEEMEGEGRKAVEALRFRERVLLLLRRVARVRYWMRRCGWKG